MKCSCGIERRSSLPKEQVEQVFYIIQKSMRCCRASTSVWHYPVNSDSETVCRSGVWDEVRDFRSSCVLPFFCTSSSAQKIAERVCTKLNDRDGEAVEFVQTFGESESDTAIAYLDAVSRSTGNHAAKSRMRCWSVTTPLPCRFSVGGFTADAKRRSLHQFMSIQLTSLAKYVLDFLGYLLSRATGRDVFTPALSRLFLCWLCFRALYARRCRPSSLWVRCRQRTGDGRSAQRVVRGNGFDRLCYHEARHGPSVDVSLQRTRSFLSVGEGWAPPEYLPQQVCPHYYAV